MSHPPKRKQIDWIPIDLDISNGMTFPDAERKYNLSHWTIRKHCKRHGIGVLPGKLKQLVQQGVEKHLEKVATAITTEEIERHKRKVFEIGSESVAKFRAKEPRSFRELKTADDMTRRAAGIEDDEGGNKLMLVQLNEAIEDHDPQEATSESLQPIDVVPLSLPNESAG